MILIFLLNDEHETVSVMNESLCQQLLPKDKLVFEQRQSSILRIESACDLIRVFISMAICRPLPNGSQMNVSQPRHPQYAF